MNYDFDIKALSDQLIVVPTIELESFKKVFWKYLVDDTLPPEEVHEATIFWVNSVAGNANVPVEVVRSDGTPIGRIPPLASTGIASNLQMFYSRIKQAREMSKMDDVNGASRFLATVEQTLRSADSGYISEYITDFIRLYIEIEGVLPQATPENIGSHEDEFTWEE